MGKQYTTAPILVNSNGDPIPQYLDITDKTDSPQGTFKPLTNETIQNVQLAGSITKEETKIFQRNGALAGGGTAEVICDIQNKYCNLQSLSIGTDEKAIQVRITTYGTSGDGLLRVPDSNGTTLLSPGISVVQKHADGENDFWRVAKYDESSNQYVLTMKRNFESYNGIRVEVVNWASTEKNIAINMAIGIGGK